MPLKAKRHVMKRIQTLFRSEFVRYVIAGGVNSVFSYGVYLLLLLILPYPAAYTISYFAGIPTGYVLNALFVFRQPLQWGKAFQFPVVFILQYGLGLLFTVILVDVLHVSETIAPALATALTVPPTFIATRTLLKPRSSTQPT